MSELIFHLSNDFDIFIITRDINSEHINQNKYTLDLEYHRKLIMGDNMTKVSNLGR